MAADQVSIGDGWVPIRPDRHKKEPIQRLYLIDCGNVVKIGVSLDVVSRIRSLSKSSGRSLDQAYVFEGEYDARGAEAHLHGVFGSQRLEGEWFSVAGERVLREPLRAYDFPPKPKKVGMDDEKAREFIHRLFPAMPAVQSATYTHQTVAAFLTSIAIGCGAKSPRDIIDAVEQFSSFVASMPEGEFDALFSELVPVVSAYLSEVVSGVKRS